jgi:hypothetical protein
MRRHSEGGGGAQCPLLILVMIVIMGRYLIAISSAECRHCKYVNVIKLPALSSSYSAQELIVMSSRLPFHSFHIKWQQAQSHEKDEVSA